MLQVANGYLIGKNDNTGKVYLEIKINDPKHLEQLEQLNIKEMAL